MGERDCLLVNECGRDFRNLCFRNVSMVGGGRVLGKRPNVIDGQVSRVLQRCIGMYGNLNAHSLVDSPNVL